MPSQAARQMGTVGGQDAVDRFTAHPTVQKENAILRGEADTYDEIRLSSAQTAGLTVGKILRKPCGTLAVIVQVITTHDSENEHDYAWCKVKTAGGPAHADGEKPNPEQVNDWSARFAAHGIGDSELPTYEQLVDAWYAYAHVHIQPVRLTYVRWTAGPLYRNQLNNPPIIEDDFLTFIQYLLGKNSDGDVRHRCFHNLMDKVAAWKEGTKMPVSVANANKKCGPSKSGPPYAQTGVFLSMPAERIRELSERTRKYIKERRITTIETV